MYSSNNDRDQREYKQRMQYLEPIDFLIQKTKMRYDDLVWGQGQEEPPVGYPNTIESAMKELEYLYDLQDRGCVYEPTF